MRWLLLAAMLPAGVAAQSLPASLNVEGVGEPVSVSVATHRGYPAYPAWTLRALGARVDATTLGSVIIFGADSLAFQTGSPFFFAAGEPVQLVDAAYREGGVFYLPHQFFAEWLPRAFPDRIEAADGRLRLRTAATAAVPADRPAAPAGGGQARRAEGGPVGAPVSAPLVVIDPGHGGPDPGRIGPSGLKEKDIVLQVSRRLARILTERGYDVRMTRNADTLIPLDARPHLANEWRGNRPGLFLSIHANGVSDRRVTGFETFFLSDARTEDERRVAEMENAAIAYEGRTRVVGADDLDYILNNLRNDFYIRASHTLAGMVQDRFRPFHPGRNRGVKQAGFIVLIGAFMPAVLIELAFISNPAEERLLGSGTFQVEATRAIAAAVDDFFKSHGDLWTGASP